MRIASRIAWAPAEVGDVCGGQMDHQEPPVGIHCDMALAPDDLLAGVVTPCLCLGRLDGLAVDHGRRRAGLASGSLTVEHQRHVVDSLKQKAPGQLAEPTIDRLPWSEMHRQHPPAAARAHQVAHRVDHLTELDLPRTAPPPGLGHQGRNLLPLLVRQVRWVTLRLLGNLRHPATTLLCPHPELESHTESSWNRFPKRALRA